MQCPMPASVPKPFIPLDMEMLACCAERFSRSEHHATIIVLFTMLEYGFRDVIASECEV